MFQQILLQAITTAFCGFLLKESYEQAAKQLSKLLKRKSYQTEEVLSSLLLLPNRQSSVITPQEHLLSLPPDHLSHLQAPNIGSPLCLPKLDISYSGAPLFCLETLVPHYQSHEYFYDRTTTANALTHKSWSLSSILFHESLQRGSGFFKALPESGLTTVSTAQEARTWDALFPQSGITQIGPKAVIQDFKRCEQFLMSLPTVWRVLLAEKEKQIQMLVKMINIAVSRPGIYAETYQQQGDTMSDKRSEASKFDLRGAQFAGGFAETVQGNHIGGTHHNYTAPERQTLAEAAAEIHQLLKVLVVSYPSDLPIETQAEIDVAVKGISKDPALKERVVAALREGGLKALEKFTDNPYVGVLAASYQGWQTGK